MAEHILVAGATGNLGLKITTALVRQGATVRAIVRKETGAEKISTLKQMGVEVVRVSLQNRVQAFDVCQGINCVVSALSGLADVVIESQKYLLDGAVSAGVPKFIPSDYSLDFTNLKPGSNRNLDLRRSFHEYLDKQNIKATTVFNGAFMDLLTGDMPLILYKLKRILYWGDPSVRMDFTLTDDVADFTAKAALDISTPRYLRIAGDSVTAEDVKNIMNDVTGEKFGKFRPGGIGLLNGFINIAKTFSKSSPDLYPPWQGMQYMRDMMEGRAVVNTHDNDRYGGLHWTSVREYLITSGIINKTFSSI
jgi:nucleoside-diphosphate-sugar epimerase